MKKQQILHVSLLILIFYALCAIFRQIGLLYLSVDEQFFAEATSSIVEIKEDIWRYNFLYYILPFLMGWIIMIFFKKKVSGSWTFFLISMFIGTLLFRLVDTRLISPLLSFANNIRTNAIITILFYIVIVSLAFSYNKRILDKLR